MISLLHFAGPINYNQSGVPLYNGDCFHIAGATHIVYQIRKLNKVVQYRYKYNTDSTPSGWVSAGKGGIINAYTVVPTPKDFRNWND